MQPTPRLAAVDGLRAMAALMVFAYHIWEFAGKPEAFAFATRGAEGVDIFMLLSGFCLFFPYCIRPERLGSFSWRDYARRRLRRIVPPYYAAIVYALGLRILIAALLIFTGKATEWPTFPTPLDLLAHLTFTHTLSRETFFGITGAFWSMGLEAQFYLMFPLVMLGFARVGPRVIGALVAVSLAYHFAINALNVGDGLVVENFFLGRWMQFGAGMAVALLVAKFIERGQKLPTLAGVGLLAFSFALFLLPAPELQPVFASPAVRGFQLTLATSALLLAICASTPPVAFAWSNRLSAGLGFISYSLFLIHQPTMQYLAQFLRQFAKIDGPPLFIALATVGLLLCVAVSYVFFLLFEKPFLRSNRVRA